jgi:hypothetical protein
MCSPTVGLNLQKVVDHLRTAEREGRRSASSSTLVNLLPLDSRCRWGCCYNRHNTNTHTITIYTHIYHIHSLLTHTPSTLRIKTTTTIIRQFKLPSNQQPLPSYDNGPHLITTLVGRSSDATTSSSSGCCFNDRWTEHQRGATSGAHVFDHEST